ncbi:MAG: hypothetical protein UY63_C0017G0067 [Parcubacteria group bacterium GW2011_GWA2_51_10]|nr:MAG: hypothetical protein UY63_C0017G0067 [Parcubacteria group bacterium GW2011_GWA2_51_10]
MKHMGIDYGSKRIGIALSDESGSIAFPESTIANDERTIGQIKKLVAGKNVRKIIMGDTRSTGGAENPITGEAEKFAEELRERTKLPVEPVFEAWSSIEASRHASGNDSHNDAAAAAFILQRYLDMRQAK